MRFDLRQLKKMIVETESGMRMGRVFNLIFDTEGQNVLQYEIGNYFNKNQYLVNRDQVVRFEENKMIVEDSVKKVRVEEDRVGVQTKAEPAMMREKT
ncbi:PRC-barrel domain-containing protein [Patescibacteria group bacterium]|nr:PRC-barrel domain-containing protein [Patescibacteria group bacterium]